MEVIFNMNLVASTGTLWATGGGATYSGNNLNTNSEYPESIHIIQITNADMISAIDNAIVNYTFSTTANISAPTKADAEE